MVHENISSRKYSSIWYPPVNPIPPPTHSLYRSLFPTLIVSLYDLELKREYDVYIRAVPVNTYRYKYLNMEWREVGETDAFPSNDKQIYRHPSSPSTGHHWMKKPISFKGIKVTNNPRSANGNVSPRYCMKSVHAYEEVLSLLKCGEISLY